MADPRTPSDIRTAPGRLARNLPWVVAVAGLVCTAVLWSVLRAADRRLLDTRLDADAAERQAAIQTRLDGLEQVVEGVVAFYDASEEVTRAEFGVFTGEVFEGWPEIRGLAWAPAVPHTALARHEQDMREAGIADYRVWDLAPDQPPAAERPLHAPLAFVQPPGDNTAAVGLDLMSEERRRQALSDARDTGRIRASAPLVLAQDPPERRSVITAVPVYRVAGVPYSVDARRSALEGWIIGAFTLDQVAAAAFTGLDDTGLGVTLRDTDPSPADEGLLLHLPSGRADRPGAEPPREPRTLPITFGGRTWTMTATPSSAWVRAQGRGLGTLAGVIGLLITGLLTATLYEHWRRADSTAHLAAELAATNRDLEGEMERRAASERERLRLERQVQHAQKLESLGILAGGVAHDFNNLLLRILGGADLALKDCREPLVAEELDRIRDAARRAAELTEQMLAYAGRQQARVQRVNLNALVEDMEGLLSASLSRRAELALDLAHPAPWITGDETQVRQVLMNLVSNAADAGADAGADKGAGIVVRTRVEDAGRARLDRTVLGESLPADRYAVLEVEDRGAGMEPQVVERIFDPFFTTKVDGRGLGLAAVLGIVRSHGGAVEVDSEAGRGTVVRVLLPAASPESADTTAVDGGDRDTATGTPTDTQTGTPTAGGDAGTVAGGATVLVVDDQPEARDLAARMLERVGYRVVERADGAAALEAVADDADGDIDAVLLDLTMPGMSGTEVRRRVHDLRPDLPVVLTTGWSKEDVRDELAGDRVAGFVHKPFVTDELVAVMAAAIATGGPGDSPGRASGGGTESRPDGGGAG